MDKKKLYPFFLLSLFVALCGQAIFPHLKLLAFAPFLALSYGRLNFIKSLWLASLCGLIIDICSSLPFFGFTALNYLIVTCCYHRYHKYFSEKSSGLPFLTFLISFSSTLLHKLFLSLCGLSFPLSFVGIITDFALMPILDGLYAFLWFSIPIMVYSPLRRRWFYFLFLRKKSKRKLNKESTG